MRQLGSAIRAVLAAAMLLSIFSVHQPAAAAVACEQPDANGTRRCKAGLTQAQVQGMQRTQEQSQWCWAAAVAMVLSHNGMAVSQEDVSRQYFGDAANRKVSGAMLTEMLTQARLRTGGAAARPDVMVGDSAARRYELDNALLVAELIAERPLVFAVNGHAMVLVEVVFEQSALKGTRVIGATVIDPAPGRGVRVLASTEMRPSYVAAVHMRQGAGQTMVAMR